MKIFVISDWQGKVKILPLLAEAIKNSNSDLIAFAGNILKWNIRHVSGLIEIEGEQDIALYDMFYKALGEIQAPFVFIPGSLDAPLAQYMQIFNGASKKFKNLNQVHNSFIPLKEDYVLAGFGGLITEKEKDEKSTLKFARWQFEFGLNFLKHFPKKKILLLHMPPVSNLDLDGGNHIGSRIINEAIESIQPEYVICGHATNSKGAQQIGRSLVINPGGLKDGNYAVLDTALAKAEFKTL